MTSSSRRNLYPTFAVTLKTPRPSTCLRNGHYLFPLGCVFKLLIFYDPLIRTKTSKKCCLSEHHYAIMSGKKWKNVQMACCIGISDPRHHASFDKRTREDNDSQWARLIMTVADNNKHNQRVCILSTAQLASIANISSTWMSFTTSVRRRKPFTCSTTATLTSFEGLLSFFGNESGRYKNAQLIYQRPMQQKKRFNKTKLQLENLVNRSNCLSQWYSVIFFSAFCVCHPEVNVSEASIILVDQTVSNTDYRPLQTSADQYGS